jgi:poly(3-hydroxybutyrate) depolymerase
MTLPTNYSSSQQYPVVFAWHYHSGTAQQIMSGGYYGIRTNFPNAIYVAGQGLPITADGGVDYAWQNTNGRDIAFTRALISWLEANYCVDTSRLFSTGFSYGGLMSDTIACQMGDVFRAIGAMAGGLFGSTSSCTGARIAAWMTHGDADTTVPISTGQAARDMVLANNHCGTTTQAVDPSPCVAYDGCDSGYPVVWCQVAGGTHSIPSYSATAIATFFKQF